MHATEKRPVRRRLRGEVGRLAAGAIGARVIVACGLFAAGCAQPEKPEEAVLAEAGPLEVDGAVSTDTPEATRTGLDILARGGNAVDAAVAVSLVLGVTEPSESGLGGTVAMLLLPTGGEGVLIDAASAAGATDTTPALPGALAVLHYAWSRYGSGRLTWSDVVEPAAQVAAKGYPLGRFSHHAIVLEYERIVADGAATRMLLAPDRSIPAEGTRVVNPELAALLGQIGEHGPDAFYAGEAGQQLAAAGSALTSPAPTPRESPALRTRYRDRVVWSAPQPGGAALAAALGFLALAPKTWIRAPGGARTAWIAEALAFTAAGGGGHPIEWFAQLPPMPSPQDLPAVDSGALVDSTAALPAAKDSLARRAPRAKASGSQIGGARPPGRGTADAATHFSVVDDSGTAVSVTQTLGASFGSGLVEHLGFFRQSPPAAQDPSLVPAIVTREGQVELVLGSPGGERGVAAVLQVLQGTIDLGEPLEDAVLAPRISVSGPAGEGRARVFLEGLVWDDPLAGLDPSFPGWGDQDETVLRARGFQVAEQPAGPWPAGMDPWFGGVNAIARTGDGWVAVGDDRRDGVGGVLAKGAPSLQRTDRAFSEPRPARER